MNKSTFKKQFPDVCMQDITFYNILCREAIENEVIKLVNGLNTGLLGQEIECRLKQETMAKYKIEETDTTITLYRRRLWFLWFVVDVKTPVYIQQRKNIIKSWHQKYGKENFERKIIN